MPLAPRPRASGTLPPRDLVAPQDQVEMEHCVSSGGVSLPLDVTARAMSRRTRCGAVLFLPLTQDLPGAGMGSPLSLRHKGSCQRCARRA